MRSMRRLLIGISGDNSASGSGTANRNSAASVNKAITARKARTTWKIIVYLVMTAALLASYATNVRGDIGAHTTQVKTEEPDESMKRLLAVCMLSMTGLAARVSTTPRAVVENEGLHGADGSYRACECKNDERAHGLGTTIEAALSKMQHWFT